LILGAGGGYGGARFLSGASEADIAARDKRIAELSKTLSEIKFDSQSAPTQQTVLQQRVKDLQSQLDQLRREKNASRTNADQQDAKAKDDAAAEIAALKKRIEEAGNLSDELARTKKAMKASDLQIVELKKTVEDQKAEIGKLQAAQQQANDAGSPALVLAQARNTMLEAQLEEAKQATADIPELKSRIAALEDQVTKASDDSDQKAAQISALQKQKNELQAKLDAANRSSTGAADQQAQKIAGLQKQLDDMAQSLAARDDDARKADDSLKAARADLDKSRASIKTLTGENARLTADRDTLQKQVASLKDMVAALKAKTPPANDQTPSNTTNAGQEDVGLTPRNSDDVHKAVADLPGFDSLAPDKQTMLIDMLVKGACVTDALKAAYGHVSPISLRSLFRDLGGSC
jgi:chromosome segregation ATPase